MKQVIIIYVVEWHATNHLSGEISVVAKTYAGNCELTEEDN